MMEFVVLSLLFIVGFYIVSTNPKKHFLLLFVLVVYFIYWFLGPINTMIEKNYYYLGGYFKDYFDTGLLIYIISLSALLFFYKIGSAGKLNENGVSNTIYQLNRKYRYFLWLFFFAVLYIVNRKSNENLEYTGGFLNYLLFLSDSLILAFIILLYEKKFKKWHLVLLIITFLFYLILGFRYRVILLLLGIFYHYYVVLNLSFKSILKWVGLFLFGVYIINFITTNRDAFRTLDFNQVTFESEIIGEMTPYQLLMHQTNNHKTDMTVLKYMHQPNVDFDYGESMFLNIVYRIIPASFFEYGKKPTIPQQYIINNSFGTIEAFYAGSAVTNPIAYYIAFGYYGVIFFMGLIGYLMGKMSKHIRLTVSRDRVKVIMMAMFLFQEITRGYLPQNITLLAFLLITFKLFYKRNANNSY